MPKADGTILIDTKINSDGAEAGTKELEAAARRLAGSLNDLGEKAKIALQKQVDSFSKLNTQYAQQAKKVEELKKKVAEYGNQKIPTQEYADIQNQINAAQKRLDALIEKQRKFVELGGKTNSRAYKSMQYDIDELANTIKYANGELDELEKSGKAFTFGANTEAAQRDMEKLAQEEAKLADMNNRLRTSYQSLEQKVGDYKKEITKADKATGKLGKTSRGTGMSIGRMLATSILFSFVFQAINGVMTAATEGMNNLAQYSDETNVTLSTLMSSLTQLKNAFATAFSPILTAIAPALNYLINLLSAAATAVAHLIAALTGKSTFVKATKVQQDYAASLEGTAGAADEAEGALAGFDKLNVLSQSQRASGGGGGAEVSPGEMFETVPVDNSLTRAIDAAKTKLKELAQIFKSGFVAGLGDVSALNSIRDSLISIGESAKDIVTDPAVTAGFSDMINSLTYDFGRIAGSFTSIGISIADNLTGGIANYLQQNSETIKGFLVSMFDITSSIGTIAANFSVALAQVFSVFRGDSAKQATADIIAIFNNSFMGIAELAAKLFRDVFALIVNPFTENAEEIRTALENTIRPAEEILRTLANSVTETFEQLNLMYNEHISPLFESIASGISEVVNTFLDGYNTYLAPVLDKLAEKFSDVWENTIQPLIDDAIGLIGDVADLVKTVWENVLQPVINWIASAIMPAVSPVLEGLGTLFLTVFDSIGQILNGFIDLARSLVQFLTGVFSTDWKSAWENVKQTFSDIFGAIPGIAKNIFNQVISGIESMINGVIDGLNGLTGKINGVLDMIPGNSLSIPVIGDVHLPRLASGTVIPPRAGEFAAILGDNKRETEVVSPLSTMKQAFKEALREAGGFGGAGEIVGYIYLDGKELGRSTVQFVRQEKKRTGRNPVLV